MMDLKKIKKLLFDNLELLLNNLDIEHEIIGDNVYSTCPIHEGSDNARAFSLSIDKQVWRCWTRDCQQEYGNDIFGLVKGVLSEREGKEINFGETLRWICKILNIDAKLISAEKEEEPNDFVKLVHTFSRCPEFIQLPIETHHQLQNNSDYFMNRGFLEETLLHFGIGDCLDKTSSMYQRAVIPIHDDRGCNIVAYIGRSIKEYRTPKFLFTKGFDKRHYLYNYHRAIGKASEKSCLFLTEGQGDVWKLFEAGVHNSVSMFGKTLSLQQQYKIQSSKVTSLIVLTDNDQAGRESKVKLQRQLGRMFKLTFPKWSRKDVGDMNVDQIEQSILSQVRGTF